MKCKMNVKCKRKASNVTRMLLCETGEQAAQRSCNGLQRRAATAHTYRSVEWHSVQKHQSSTQLSHPKARERHSGAALSGGRGGHSAG